MRLLLISNSTEYGRAYLDHCADTIVNRLGRTTRRVLFVPYALHDWDMYASKVRARFAALGYSVDSIHESPSPARALETAEALFVGGGNTFRLVDALWRLALVEPIRRRAAAGLPYIGVSAGSNVACPTIKTTNDMPIVEPRSFEALGLVPFNINPHYLDSVPNSRHMGETREQRLAEFHEDNAPAVVGLREGAWLVIDGPTVLLEGSAGARLFRRGEPPVECPAGSRLDFLLA